MKWHCWLFGHDPGSRQMDTGFHEYSYCRRCGAALELEEGKWKEAEPHAEAASPDQGAGPQ